MVVVSQPLSVDRCAHTIHMIGRPWNHSKGGPWNPPPWFEQRYAQTKVCKVRVRRSPADEAVVRSACGRARRRHRRRCPRITDIRLPRRPRRHATPRIPPPRPQARGPSALLRAERIVRRPQRREEGRDRCKWPSTPPSAVACRRSLRRCRAHSSTAGTPRRPSRRCHPAYPRRRQHARSEAIVSSDRQPCVRRATRASPMAAPNHARIAAAQSSPRSSASTVSAPARHPTLSPPSILPLPLLLSSDTAISHEGQQRRAARQGGFISAVAPA